ncbi:hypothetical protein B9Z55_017233 [Caenorhabditis nigoni]|uniref:G-protein coupled receptors family 1 profile domain-containing protein n=1 Tax=Caenorhabditis nigoni TaxID=1611254 RepID=A0A2G5T860_9PELO|nr:hypothetical protein B9Z55_017233 [Caenorhabditis nigoni]
MQKAFLIAILLQISVPLITLIIPAVYFFFAIGLNYHNQSLTNIAITCTSTHGFISTIVMIMVHRPYREAFFAMIGKTRKENMPEVPMRTTKIDVIKY